MNSSNGNFVFQLILEYSSEETDQVLEEINVLATPVAFLATPNAFISTHTHVHTETSELFYEVSNTVVTTFIPLFQRKALRLR